VSLLFGQLTRENTASCFVPLPPPPLRLLSPKRFSACMPPLRVIFLTPHRSGQIASFSLRGQHPHRPTTERLVVSNFPPTTIRFFLSVETAGAFISPIPSEKSLRPSTSCTTRPRIFFPVLTRQAMGLSRKVLSKDYTPSTGF